MGATKRTNATEINANAERFMTSPPLKMN